MRKPLEPMKVFADRREILAGKMMGSVLIVASAPEHVRNASVHHSFRQDSNFYYLTGFEEPEAVFVFRPGRSPETIMFVRPKDKTRETWDGFRYGPQGVESEFRIDKAYPISEFEKEIVNLLKGVDSVYCRMFKNAELDRRLRSALLDLKNSQGRTGLGLLSIHDADEFLGEMRVLKTPHDIELQKKACEITSEAHREVMRYTKPGMSERELHGYFLYQIMKRGASREGYGSIFAAGANACTLHYVFNDQELRDRELLLIDAAGEYKYFTADITRTFPVSGKFTDAQKAVYEGVLTIQKKLIESVKPGITFQSLHEAGADMLTDLMLHLGLLTGRKDDLMKANEHKKYYPHGIGHYLGMDVHDAGLYQSKKGEPRKIEQGMIFTIEPGLYIPIDDLSAPAEFRGIGIRIEDNILVTSFNHENLTERCPKEITDLENLIGVS
jgi:Xaa-Pro aminopeptidase